MSQAWSQSATSLESIYMILNDHNHTFVLVEQFALKLMGVPVHLVNIALQIVDILLEVDESSIPGVVMMSQYWEHHVISEDTYHLTVDTEKVQVPHPINFNPTVMESEFHPNPTKQRVKPYLIMDQNVKFVWHELVTFLVFILSIPEFFDLCLNCMGGQTYLDDNIYHISQIDMDNLARYLVLDSTYQQDELLSKVKNAKQLAEYFAHWQW
ncbi:hypothetical protein L873DRAFT_1924700 [Choiromyces venosus 120613-1]|uniref:Uncharacterized protein n=1 Tax=Choiromyces venosus 120613-1 TaxID=1336337 RepID=A0A3N4JHX8_9PEZI|nr:hypothetical protein L873DRAFT_1924700 [Choiromyces venosus 120613-1]